MGTYVFGHRSEVYSPQFLRYFSGYSHNFSCHVTENMAGVYCKSYSNLTSIQFPGVKFYSQGLYQSTLK